MMGYYQVSPIFTDNDLAYTVATLCPRYIFTFNRHQMRLLDIRPRNYAQTVKGMFGQYVETFVQSEMLC
jgi:hypothetical protein